MRDVPMVRFRRHGPRRPSATAGALLSAALLVACGDDPAGLDRPSPLVELSCSISTDEIFSGTIRDGIPALSNPPLAAIGEDGLDYLRDDDRVVGLLADGAAVAVPLNILWWHEIVNFDFGDARLAVTHCPLTGSSLAFDRAGAGGAEFGVSGLLYRNNLIMYDRAVPESLWPQMSRGARCGTRTGTDLELHPLLEMTWEGWRTLHPETRVVTSGTGFERDYRRYPYGDYDRIDNRQLNFPMSFVDERRLPKERVLGIPDGRSGGVAFPFGELRALGQTATVRDGGRVVFWDARREAAMAFNAELDGQDLGFRTEGGRIVDPATGTVWNVGGVGVEGPLAGRRLEPVADAYVAYWFAWAGFQRDAALWLVP